MKIFKLFPVGTLKSCLLMFEKEFLSLDPIKSFMGMHLKTFGESSTTCLNPVEKAWKFDGFRSKLSKDLFTFLIRLRVPTLQY